MSTVQESTFGYYLLLRGLLSAEQLSEAQTFAEREDISLGEAAAKLSYLSPEQASQAEVEYSELLSFEILTTTEIAKGTEIRGPKVARSIIELVPESVARENVILPVGFRHGILIILMSDPSDGDLLQKLQFILNVDIQPLPAPRELIIEAINRHYGIEWPEAVESMLQEFTDAAIHFSTSGAYLEDSESIVAELAEDDDESEVVVVEEAKSVTTTATEPAKRRKRTLVQRQATVRYYQRMNPQRLFPLLVVLSRKQILEIVKRQVTQANSSSFEVAIGSSVEVEPILPGCSCYPPKEQVPISEEPSSTTFWVAPHVLGSVMQARVVVRQGGKALAEIPLQIRVVKQGLTMVLGALSLVLPFLLVVIKHFRLDFESQFKDGFGLYAQLLDWLIRFVSPELLTAVLLLCTACAYLLLRPRQRDVFWDIEMCNGAESSEATTHAEDISPMEGDATSTTSASSFFREAEQHFVRQEYPKALDLYRCGLKVGNAQPKQYQRAALAAHYSGDTQLALAILEEASLTLHPRQLPGALWFNMGCFATRLGRFSEAMRYLNRAVDAGYNNAAKFRSDLDLAALRLRPDFKRLLESLES